MPQPSGTARRQRPDHRHPATALPLAPASVFAATGRARAALTRAPIGRLAGLALTGLALTACVNSPHTPDQTARIQVESPRASAGIIIEEPTDIGLARLSAAMDRLSEPRVSASMLNAIREQQSDALTDQQEPVSAEEMVRSAWAGSAAATQPVASDTRTPPAALAMPADAGRLLPLKKLSQFEVAELLTSIGLRLQAQLGYQSAAPAQIDAMGPAPRGMTRGPAFTRTAPDESIALIRLGSMRYASQLPQFWAQGVVVDAAGTVVANPDLDTLSPMIEAAQAEIDQMRTGLVNADLDRQLVRLSFTNSASAINALKGFGVTTVEKIEGLPATVDFAQLPIVTQMPGPTDSEMALIGDSKIARGQFGVSIATDATALPASVNASPASQLMVLYHPAHPEQLSMVRTMLKDFIDRPANQIFVEGMVLEISEEGLDQLGVEWQFRDGPLNLVLGSLDPSIVADTLDGSFLDSANFAFDWGVRLQALVREGKAEVLSRPSVLTMDNRQATIRVGEDIPIATSQEGALNSNKIAFNFSYIPTGILLNIRPRMTESGDEVSILVDALVSAQVTGRDLEIRSADGDLLASAPTISTRRVQTYARIANKTPFIIGGLVSRDRSVTEQKVPFLGDLPLIGNAFRSKRTSSQKREVIIVLTPHVLPIGERAVSRTIPKDDDLFDSTGNRLFRDSYRIRAEDVFDLRFLAENKRLSAYRDLARRVIAANFRMAAIAPFSEFAEHEIPGEEMLIQRMMYELIRRTGVDQRVNPDRMIYFEAEETEGYRVRFLADVLSRLGTGEDAQSFFERNTGKALAVTFRQKGDSTDIKELASEPVPEIALVDCPDRDTWKRLLWDLNQPDANGVNRSTVLLHAPRDIERLQRAIMLKQVIAINAESDALSLKNFTTGRVLQVPAFEDDKVTVVDAEVARFFFVTELYYAAMIKRIQETTEAMDRAMEDSALRSFIEAVE